MRPEGGVDDRRLGDDFFFVVCRRPYRSSAVLFSLSRHCLRSQLVSNKDDTHSKHDPRIVVVVVVVVVTSLSSCLPSGVPVHPSVSHCLGAVLHFRPRLKFVFVTDKDEFLS